MSSAPTPPTARPARTAPSVGPPLADSFLAALDRGTADDVVVGCARLPAGGDTLRLRIVATWHGHDRVVADLPRLGALALDGAAAVEERNGSRWSGLRADLRRADLDVVRIGELRPGPDGEDAAVVHDPLGAVDQWIRWSRGRDRAAAAPSPPEALRAAAVLETDSLLRSFEAIVPGARRLLRSGGDEPLRPMVARRLREAASGLRDDGAVETSLAARVRDALRGMPGPGAGTRDVPGRRDPGSAYDAFLRVADDEGFLGDRVLFDAARAHLAGLTRRTPVYDEGFVVPTFDAVEVRWRIGDGVGGCKVPFVPCIHVGVGVTPEDHLEFWAAPALREPLCAVAAIGDDGRRTVLPRTSQRDAFLSTLLAAVDAAWDALPSFLRTARRAGRTQEPDADAALAPLHLPKSLRAGALALLPARAGASRLSIALALARCGDDAEPLVARKLALASGRLVATTPPSSAPADAAC